jgi:hypothetical protein
MPILPFWSRSYNQPLIKEPTEGGDKCKKW